MFDVALFWDEVVNMLLKGGSTLIALRGSYEYQLVQGNVFHA